MKRRSLAGRILDTVRKALKGVTEPKHPWRGPSWWPKSAILDTTPPPRHEILQALDQISPEHREILIFKDVHGLSYVAIARRLGVPEDSVADKLFQARRAFLEPWTALRPAAPFLNAPSSVPIPSEDAMFPRRKNLEKKERPPQHCVETAALHGPG